jgi:predicted metal-dependent phosphoesterase TrpH
VSHGDATRTVDEGTRVDMHVKVLDERVATRAKARGLDALVYAPHFVRRPEIRERAARFTDDDLLVVPAREVFTGTWRDRRHVLAVGLESPVPDFVTLEGALAELDRQGAAVLVPHPEFFNISLDAGEIAANAGVVDAIEAYNAKGLPHQNRRSTRVAAGTDHPAFASSYAHLRGTVGEAWTAFDRAVESEADLVEALRAGEQRRAIRRSGTSHRLRGLIEFSHLAYENSWKKFDRVVRSGREATHPGRPAYGGRFDDVRVY